MAAAKKSSKPWKKRGLLEVDGKIEGHGLRFISKESRRYDQAMREGWVPVNRANGGALKVNHNDPNDIRGGTKMTSAVEYGDVVLCAMPDEDIESYNEYVAEQTKARGVESVRNELKGNLGRSGSRLTRDSKIVIE